jgi:leucyl aminopeptidase
MALNISIKTHSFDKLSSACLVVAVREKRKLTDSAQQVDKRCGGLLTQIVKKGDMDGKTGQALMVHTSKAASGFDRVLLVGCGKDKALSVKDFRTVLNSAFTTLFNSGAKEAVCFLSELEVKDKDAVWVARQTAELAHQGIYRFNQTKSEKEPLPVLKKLALNMADKKQLRKAQTAIKVANAIASGVALARDLGNLPGNICTPSYLASQANKEGKAAKGMSVKVLNQKDMEKLKMGSLLSVAKGSRQPPKLIVMNYQGGKKTDKPIVLVGKGITFDSGGISIKPSAAMDEMKFDMCGAASVLGTMKTVGELQLPINVIGIVPSCENMPDGSANKPGDIVTSMSGQTIEVLNTDAEGRLILCDALTYSERFKPKAVIDVATLTGACVVALGKHAAGLLGNDQGLIDKINQAGIDSGDRAWPMPMWDEYQDQLKSNFADIANIGGRDAGTITAACFLSRFTKQLKWAHLDIAGVAWESNANKGATGRPVPLLTQFLLDQAKGKIGI